MKIKIFLFCLLTWGIILVLPFSVFFVVRHWQGESNSWLPLASGCLVFVVGIVFGEWWSRLVTRLIYGAKK
jgi:hypothetical protein